MNANWRNACVAGNPFRLADNKADCGSCINSCHCGMLIDDSEIESMSTSLLQL
jgi:hypothetical protein